MDQKRAEVMVWLQEAFGSVGKKVPQFEYSPSIISELHKLSIESRCATHADRALAHFFNERAKEYQLLALRNDQLLDKMEINSNKFSDSVQNQMDDLITTADEFGLDNVASSSFMVAMADLSLSKEKLKKVIMDTETRQHNLSERILKATSFLANLKAVRSQLSEESNSNKEIIRKRNEQIQVMMQKEDQYKKQIAHAQSSVSNAGYFPELSHGHLLDLSNQRKEIIQKSKNMKSRLQEYYNLPPDKDVVLSAIEEKKQRISEARVILEEKMDSQV